MVATLVLIHTQCGPYHIARVKALQQIYSGEVELIQLASKEKQREWTVNANTTTKLTTIHDGDQTEISATTLTNNLLIHLKKIQPSVVVIAGYASQPMRAAAQWAKTHNIPTVMFSDSHHLDKPRNFLKEKLKGFWICKYFDAAFVSGASAALYLNSLGFPADRIWRTYDVVDNNYFTKLAEEARQQGSRLRIKLHLPKRYFLYVGRFSPEKNLIRLLEAYQLYHQQMQINDRESWSLVLVGSGPQENALKEKVVQMGLKNVFWQGFKQVDMLPYYYGLSSALILPSISEPWGLVVNEAMACSLPVLISDRCGCLLDLVFPGVNGYVFNSLNIDKMATTLIHLSELPSYQLEEMGKSSQKIINNYTLQNWAKALVDCAQFLN